MAITEKHFVHFYSPGTLFHEESSKPIDSWDMAAAVQMAESIRERYNARPFGFRFITRLVGDPVPDGRGGILDVEPREVSRSAMYYLGGKVETRAQVDARADPGEQILRSNMHGNNIERIITVTNGFKSVHEFRAEDSVVDATGAIVMRGNS